MFMIGGRLSKKMCNASIDGVEYRGDVRQIYASFYAILPNKKGFTQLTVN